MFELNCGDATQYLKSLPDQSVDLIVTDPAYSSLEKHRKIGKTTRLKKRWFPVVPDSYYPGFLEQCYRVLKKNSHLYLFCDQETLFVLKPEGEQAGFKFWKFIVWDKILVGMGYHYRASHELIIFFEKGKLKLNDLGVRDVLQAKRVRSDYPTEKPLSILKTLIKQSTEPGQIVCDPFCGSGSTGEAAVDLGREFWGNDIEKHAYNHTLNRLNKFV